MRLHKATALPPPISKIQACFPESAGRASQNLRRIRPIVIAEIFTAW
jgi:hypothetical protein